MNIPQVIANLITAQNEQNAVAYAECFAGTAIVHDEGKVHRGKVEIQQWIKDANEAYNSVMKPLNYEENGAESLLTAEVNGTFPGSPALLKFHFIIEEQQITSLKITS
ncbi:nuclear transport factor 2 family protein [Mucilaginibacter sp. SMC90]|uniref:nuclear transport factor 2 family protein n=1 Tax=Mucilaginibacter sp. SMC90 TaxID=2929803 RepID=UPI001FB29265|nr:nuclear transport factor 2 family protein [Mucilaginibacter sp. SMC90]UOE50877.1 nuclear transport factor 2 family protein [Mucilaginibacter sp. SMC90]